ncbi:uncharacterized protein LOC118561971 [Fundulus heteroclitus]|uniref:uncharacterized protein LOC118561971 n=1 Tax=Fundulus heteroclitus TaxID=8078 RepID=UPI00165B5A09|nr:uncharacterized protein LOC118561971 [Fundulus heteroclitus]
MCPPRNAAPLKFRSFFFLSRAEQKDPEFNQTEGVLFCLFKRKRQLRAVGLSSASLAGRSGERNSRSMFPWDLLIGRPEGQRDGGCPKQEAPQGWCRIWGHHPLCPRCHGPAGTPLLSRSIWPDPERSGSAVSTCAVSPSSQWRVRNIPVVFKGCNVKVVSRRGLCQYESSTERVCKKTHTQIAPAAHTCQQMAQSTITNKVHWKVVFFLLLRQPAWWDTLLGGTGALSVSNTFDNKVTKTMLSNTEQHASRAVHQIGMWMPIVVTSQEETAKIFLKELNWQIKMWNTTAEVLTNISVALNWTVCNVQMKHAHIQQEWFKRVVIIGNFHEWRQLWNISSRSWLQLELQKTYCNATMCEGHWTQYDVTNSTTVCHYYILPVVTVQGYWFLKLDGDWFGPQTNYTYDLDLCETADKGMVCMLQQGHLNPCLTKKRCYVIRLMNQLENKESSSITSGAFRWVF